MIRYRQIIVNGLWHAHKSLRLVMRRRIIGQHFNRIHGVVAARVKQALDIMLLHDLKNLLVNVLMSLDLRHLKTAGTKKCRRRSL